jgi:hypothetical protein
MTGMRRRERLPAALKGEPAERIPFSHNRLDARTGWAGRDRGNRVLERAGPLLPARSGVLSVVSWDKEKR